MSPLFACLNWALLLNENEGDLGRWWTRADTQAAIKRLDAAEQAQLVVVKDGKKRAYLW